MVQAAFVTVVDPIYPSLWDATFSELGGETRVWEVFADAENFLAEASADAQADEAERVLHRLRREGWARISARPLDAPEDSTATPLSDDNAEAVLRRARAWFLTEREPRRPVPEDLIAVFLDATEEWHQQADPASH
jgi:hypothetical protein